MPRYGIICYSLADSTVKRFKFDENDPKALRGGIYGMMETHSGEILVSTNTAGIGILNQKDLTIDNYPVATINGYKYNLRETVISENSAINNQQIFISSLVHGGFIFDFKKRLFTKNLTARDGLPQIE